MTSKTKKNLSIVTVASLGVIAGATLTVIASKSISPAFAQSNYSECKTLPLSTSGYPRPLNGWNAVGGGNSDNIVYAIVCR